MSNTSDHSLSKTLAPMRAEAIAATNDAADHRTAIVYRGHRFVPYGGHSNSRTQATTPRKSNDKPAA
jgi:hypothetical protein